MRCRCCDLDSDKVKFTHEDFYCPECLSIIRMTIAEDKMVYDYIYGWGGKVRTETLEEWLEENKDGDEEESTTP